MAKQVVPANFAPGERLTLNNPFSESIKVSIAFGGGAAVEFIAAPRQYFAITRGLAAPEVTFDEIDTPASDGSVHVGDIAPNPDGNPG